MIWAGCPRQGPAGHAVIGERCPCATHARGVESGGAEEKRLDFALRMQLARRSTHGTSCDVNMSGRGIDAVAQAGKAFQRRLGGWQRRWTGRFAEGTVIVVE